MNTLAKIRLFIKKAFRMTNEYGEDYNDEESSWVEYALAFISGAALGYGLYKLLSRGKEHYECPRCNNIFKGNPLRCPYCNLKLIWRQ